MAYHAPCQQQGHFMGKPAMDLLTLVPGLDLREMNACCCGIAGTYGLKREKYDIAMKVGADLFGQVDASGARLVACDSETCRWQIEHGTHRPRCIRSSCSTARTGCSSAWWASSSCRTAPRWQTASSSSRARWVGGCRSRRPAASTTVSSGPTPRVHAAIERAMSDAGVLVLMDLAAR